MSTEMTRRPELVLSPWVKGEPFVYRCSLCGRTFLPPEDRNPKEAMKELREAFEEHIREAHSGEADDK